MMYNRAIMNRPEHGVSEVIIYGGSPSVVNDQGDVMPYDDYADQLDTDYLTNVEYIEPAASAELEREADVAASDLAVEAVSKYVDSLTGGAANVNGGNHQSAKLPLLRQYDDAYNRPDNRPRFDINAWLGRRSVESGRTAMGYYGSSGALPPMEEMDLTRQIDYLTYHRILTSSLQDYQARLANLEASSEYQRQYERYQWDEEHHNDNSPIAVETPPLVEQGYRLWMLIDQVKRELQRIEKFDQRKQ